MIAEVMAGSGARRRSPARPGESAAGRLSHGREDAHHPGIRCPASGGGPDIATADAFDRVADAKTAITAWVNRYNTVPTRPSATSRRSSGGYTTVSTSNLHNLVSGWPVGRRARSGVQCGTVARTCERLVTVVVGGPVSGIVAGAAHAATAGCITQADGRTFCIGNAPGVAGISAFLIVLFVIYAGLVVLSIVAAVKIVTKAGYSGWWVLIVLVPIVGAVMVLVFAFSKWPVTREVETLRAQANGPAPFSPAPFSPAPRSGEALGTPEQEPARPLPPAGWFPTPDGRRRYWDGSAWTDHYA